MTALTCTKTPCICWIPPRTKLEIRTYTDTTLTHVLHGNVGIRIEPIVTLCGISYDDLGGEAGYYTANKLEMLGSKKRCLVCLLSVRGGQPFYHNDEDDADEDEE